MKMDHIFQKRAPILIQVEIYFWVFRSGLGLDGVKVGVNRGWASRRLRVKIEIQIMIEQWGEQTGLLFKIQFPNHFQVWLSPKIQQIMLIKASMISLMIKSMFDADPLTLNNHFDSVLPVHIIHVMLQNQSEARQLVTRLNQNFAKRSMVQTCRILVFKN